MINLQARGETTNRKWRVPKYSVEILVSKKLWINQKAFCV